MPDEPHIPLGGPETAPGPQGPPGGQVQVPIDAAKLETAYTNFFRVTGTTEELVLDFGLHTQMVLPGNVPEPVKLSHRVVMSFYTAKRLLNALNWAIARHENNFGALETDPQKRLRMRPAGGFPT
jgi:hypothetical protein